MKYSSGLKLFYILFFTTLISINNNSSAQVQTVPVEHPVYPFLKRMQIAGILKNYDDIILPISQKKVIGYLNHIDSLKYKLSSTDRQFLRRMEQKFGLVKNEKTIDLFKNFPGSLPNIFIKDTEKHIYNYKDSSVSFIIDPVVETKYIYSDKFKNNSTLLNFGGIIRGDYSDWLGFYVEATNGAVFGSRNTALLDRRVEQSYTFNHTKINFFDGTKGYIRLQKGIASLQLGRERILWGNGYINKMILSDNPPMFDFIRFNIAYKKLRYDFIHGWLVQKPVIKFYNALKGDIKSKSSKYIAASRLGYRVNNGLSLGISQIIIYSDRPIEAAYLNPFLFWESAQRSMNDLDNSFLSFDGRYHLMNGIEMSAAIIFDDINFKHIFNGQWSASNNGEEWLAGTMLSGPILPNDMTLTLEYMQARPYIFSHPGIAEALTYTNNGYLLGTDMQPNSTRFSSRITYRFSRNLFTSLTYCHTIHGNNVYDAHGKLVKNYGGSVFDNYAIGDAKHSYLLNGIREVSDNFEVGITYEINSGIYWNFEYNFQRDKKAGTNNLNNYFWTSLKLDFE